MILLKTTSAATVFFLCMLLLLPSCSNETEIGGGHRYTGEKVMLNIQMEARDTADPDLEITGVRVIVFNGDGELVFNGAPDPVANSTDGSRVVKVKVPRGTNHVYIFCNETEELAGKLANVNAKGDIENITFNAVGITGVPPMYGKVENAFVEARSDGSQATVTVGGTKLTELPVQVTRLVARLGFTAIKNVDTTQEEDFKVTKISIRVCRMPKLTTVGEDQAYTADEWSDELLIGQEGLLDNNGTYTVDKNTVPYSYTVLEGINSIVLPETYIPEHILSDESDASRATYLKIEAECRMKDGSERVLRGIYLLNIGQGSSAPNYNLKRNNSYHIYATITGLGALGIYAEIVEMEQHDITINWKPIDGLALVSDKRADYNDDGTSKNVNVWDDYSVYSGILKTYHSETGYKDAIFKYGSLIAVNNSQTTGTGFTPPASSSELEDILWYPGSYAATDIAGWEDIPYRQSGDISSNIAEDVEKALGDPCKLVGLSPVQINNGTVDNNLWHMATRDEYQRLIDAEDGISYSNGYGTYHYLLLPYDRYRNENGVVADESNRGYFWTTTAASAFIIDGTSGSITESQNKQRGYTVRCVRNTIPESTMTVDGIISVDYQGNWNKDGASFTVKSNIPYWTATLVTSGNDISFEKGTEGIRETHGSYTQKIPVYIKRKESTSIRSFRVRVEGHGLDGEIRSKEFFISQSGYTYSVDVTFDPVISGNVPQAGETYSITVTIKPADVAVPVGKLLIQAVYQSKVLASSKEVDIVYGQYNYSNLSIKIPENKAPDVISLDIIIYVLQNNKLIQLGGRTVLQSGKNNALQSKK